MFSKSGFDVLNDDGDSIEVALAQKQRLMKPYMPMPVDVGFLSGKSLA